MYKYCEKCSPVFPVGFLVIDILYQFAVSGRQSLVFTIQFIILALKHAAFLTSRVKREKTCIKRQENDASTIIFRLKGRSLAGQIHLRNKCIAIFRKETTSGLTGFYGGPLFWSNWNLEMLVFEEREKYREPGEKPPEQSENHNKLNPQFAPRWNIGWRRALSPLRHPCSLGFVKEIHKEFIFEV